MTRDQPLLAVSVLGRFAAAPAGAAPTPLLAQAIVRAVRVRLAAGGRAETGKGE